VTQIGRPRRIFYGWWIVVATFLNLFFAVGVIFYGFPVFYPSFVASLGFTRAQVTQGFLLGFLVVGLPCGLLAGVVIDRIGARSVILYGISFIGVPLVLMGYMTRFWQYELLCVLEVLGYTLTGPIANQVLISQWFRVRRGRAMGYAYLGLGLGGAVSPPLSNLLIRAFGWRHALQVAGTVILLVLFPVGIWITRSTPGELGLLPDGFDGPDAGNVTAIGDARPNGGTLPSRGVAAAVRTSNFWLILLGSTLVLGAVNAVVQHLILFLWDQGYLSALLVSSLGGRVLVGYLADRFDKKNTMALFYLLLGAAIPLLYVAHYPIAAWTFAVAFGFSMGADYMLIPLVTAECFGVTSLGKLLALIIMGYTVGQWSAPWIAGRIFDLYHSYGLTWEALTVACVLGAAAIYAMSVPSPKTLRAS
jgi:MFS family permease